MKCPACFNELAQMQVGHLSVDVCQGGCGGIWFDAFELQRVDEQHEAAGDHLLEIKRDVQTVVDSSRKRECPRCAGMKLRRHFFSPQRHVEVDECPNCGGCWLDHGELAQIRLEKAQAAELSAARQAVLSTSTLRYLYRLQNTARNNP